MSEEDKPIFPRPFDKDDELYQKVRQKLEQAESEQKISCSNCQTENSVKAKFCRLCGKELNSDAPFPNAETTAELISDEIHTTMYGPPPTELEEEKFELPPAIMYGPPPVLEITRELPITEPNIQIDEKDIIVKEKKANILVAGLDYEEWKGRIPWLIIGGIIGFLIASVIILTLVLLIVAIR